MAQPVVLPSGMEAKLHEIIGEGSPELRLRYVSDGFDPMGADSQSLLEDMILHYEGYSSGVVAVMDVRERFAGITGTVAELFAPSAVPAGPGSAWT